MKTIVVRLSLWLSVCAVDVGMSVSWISMLNAREAPRMPSTSLWLSRWIRIPESKLIRHLRPFFGHEITIKWELSCNIPPLVATFSLFGFFGQKLIHMYNFVWFTQYCDFVAISKKRDVVAIFLSLLFFHHILSYFQMSATVFSLVL